MTVQTNSLRQTPTVAAAMTVVFLAAAPIFCTGKEVVWNVLDNPCANLDPSDGSGAIHRLTRGAMEYLNNRMENGGILILEFPAGQPVQFKAQGILLNGESKHFKNGTSPFVAPEIKGNRRLVVRGSTRRLDSLATIRFRHNDDTGFDFRSVNNITIEHLHFTAARRYKYEGDIVRVNEQRVLFRPTPGFTSVEEVEAKAKRQRTLRRILGDPMDPEPDMTLGKYVLDGDGAKSTDQAGVYAVTVTRGDAGLLRPGDHLAFKNKISGDVIRLDSVRDVIIRHCRFTKTPGRMIKSRECDGLVICHNQLDRGAAIDTDGDGAGDRKSFYASNGGGMMIGYAGKKAPLIEYNRILCCADDVLGLTDSGYEQTGVPTPGLVVRGNIFRGAHGDCIILRPASGALIENNQFIQVRQAAVRTNAKSTVTENITIRNNVLIGQGGTFGFVGLPEAPDSNIRITGNTIIGLPGTALDLGYNRNILFENNVIRAFSYPLEKVGLIGIGSWNRTEDFQLDGTGRANRIFGTFSKLRKYVVPGRDYALPTGTYNGPEVEDLSIQFVPANGNMEFGVAESEKSDTTVKLINSYQKPALLVTPVSGQTGTAAPFEITEVRPSSFTVQMPAGTRLHYLVLEEGAYRLADGIPVEAHQTPVEMNALTHRYSNPVVLQSSTGMVVVESFGGIAGGVQFLAGNYRVSGSQTFALEHFLFTPRGAILGGNGRLSGQYPLRTATIRLDSTDNVDNEIPVLIFQVGAALRLEQHG